MKRFYCCPTNEARSDFFEDRLATLLGFIDTGVGHGKTVLSDEKNVLRNFVKEKVHRCLMFIYVFTSFGVCVG